MAPWCIHISCLERVARSGSGRDSVRGLVGAMDAELSRPDWLATVQSGRKQVQSRVCTPSFSRFSCLILVMVPNTRTVIYSWGVVLESIFRWWQIEGLNIIVHDNVVLEIVCAVTVIIMHTLNI